MAGVAEGQLAPTFTLPSSEGDDVSLEQFRGKKVVVLYFYPKDNTQTCTKQACGFRDQYAAFRAADVEILGVSADDSKSHEKFSAKYELPFLLLADTDKKVCELYGVYKEKSMYGRTYMGIERTTFVIDKMGVVRKIFPKVKMNNHIDDVLKVVENINT